MGLYRTIVADPPWKYDSWPGTMGPNSTVRLDGERDNRRRPIGYPTMSVGEIAALPIGDLADSTGCHVYLWTTNRYLRDAFWILDQWGVRFGQLLVWAKTPMGLGPGRFGSLPSRRRVDSTWFNWPRMDRQHSRKPDAFLDLVEQVSPEPRIELFARRNRLGWDTWGNEALNHVGHFEDTPPDDIGSTMGQTA
jgi:N6-adenosine-specific RNA methylase IME4